MQVILLERVDNLGAMGEEVTVKPGYARNFLLPQEKALRATEANRKRFAVRGETHGTREILLGPASDDVDVEQRVVRFESERYRVNDNQRDHELGEARALDQVCNVETCAGEADDSIVDTEIVRADGQELEVRWRVLNRGSGSDHWLYRFPPYPSHPALLPIRRP